MSKVLITVKKFTTVTWLFQILPTHQKKFYRSLFANEHICYVWSTIRCSVLILKFGNNRIHWGKTRNDEIQKGIKFEDVIIIDPFECIFRKIFSHELPIYIAECGSLTSFLVHQNLKKNYHEHECRLFFRVKYTQKKSRKRVPNYFHSN